ncbi:MAG: DNA primase [Chloroflexota bacterium]|nr:DNA primase [Chloroflexota bacterium]MDE2895155.1 DNA primase [Chloroflexota bacterium]
MSVAEEVKAKIDIVDLIAAEVPLKRSGSTFKAPCPFHAEKTPSFIVNPDRQTWHCFGACSEGGDAFSWEMKRHNVDFREALQRLAQRAGVQLRPRTDEQVRRDEQRQRLLRANDSALHFWRGQLQDASTGRDAQDYLRERGISAESAQRFNLGLSGSDPDALVHHLSARGIHPDDAAAAGLILQAENGPRDRFRDRLMFPIRNARGETVGFGGRTLIGEPAKYVNTPESDLFRKRDLLYGFDLARGAIRETGSVIIVEGYTDVISAHEFGSPNAVASMGTALTETQIGLIKPLATDIRLALDPDAAGRAAARRGIDTAREALGTEQQVATDFRRVGTLQNQLTNDIRIIPLPEGRDPDDLIRSEPDRWQTLVDTAPTFLDWLVEHARSRHNLDTPRGRADFLDELMPTVGSIGHAVLREEYLRRVAAWARVEPESLLNRQAPPRLRESGVRHSEAPAMRRHEDRQQTFIVQLALGYESARDALEPTDIELIEDTEDRAILNARLAAADDAWSDHLTESEDRIARHLRDAKRLPPYSDAEAGEAIRDAVGRVQRKRSKEGLRLKNMEIGERERELGVDELARAAAQLENSEACDPDLVEAAHSVVQARDAARRLHQPSPASTA